MNRCEIENQLRDAMARGDVAAVEKLVEALIAEGGTLYEDLPEDLKHAIDIAVSDIKDNPWEGRAGFIDEMFTAFLETHGDDIEADYENSTKTGFESFGENVRMF